MKPTWIEDLVDEKGLEEIRGAVARVEKRTSAEIVPMIVERSVATGHVPWLIFLLAFVFLSGLIPLLSRLTPSLHFWVIEAMIVVLSLIASLLLSNSDTFSRWLTPARDREAQVERRALLEFHLLNIDATREGKGVLLFVSHLERKAVVLGDKAVAERLSQSTWQEAIDALLKKVDEGRFSEGMVAAIDLLGERLQASFPAIAGDTDELPDRLVIKP